MVVNETNPVESRERIENIKYLITAEKYLLKVNIKILLNLTIIVGLYFSQIDYN